MFVFLWRFHSTNGKFYITLASATEKSQILWSKKQQEILNEINWETIVAICHLGNVIWQAHFFNLIETLQTYINFQDKGY